MPNEQAPPAAGWLQRIMDSGLVGPAEVGRLMKGDFSALAQVLPQLLADPEFAAIPEIQAMLGALNKRKGGEGSQEVRSTDRGENGAAGPRVEVDADVPFDSIGDAFGTRLCALLGSAKLGGQIQINMEITNRGVVFQLLRHVEGDEGPEIVPFSSAVKSNPRTVGRWLRTMLKQASAELRQMEHDEQMLEDDGEQESAPPERGQQRQPRG